MDNNFDNLPDVYVSDSGDNISTPVWRLLAPGFYGDTYWLDGEILAMDIAPNHHLEPLNKAAGVRMVQWLNSLPLQSASLRDEDLIEASFMLRPREGVPEMTHQQFSHAIIKLALELKAKREGGQLRMPELQGVRPASKSSAPPMPNAHFSDPRLLNTMAGQAQGGVVPQPQLPGKRVQKVNKALGTMPAQGAQQS
jgi:hypothetical protein